MESRKVKRNNNKKSSPKEKKQPKQISIFTLLFILVIIAIFIGIYFGVRALVITLKYKYYTDKMYTYGYNELYENNKATSLESSNNAEMLSVILGSLTNSKKPSDVYYLADDNVSDAVNWYNYSKYLGVNDDVVQKNLTSTASKINAVMIITEMIEGFLDVKIEKADLKMNQEVLNEFTKEQQDTIAKAVTLGLIKNKTSAIKSNPIIKGELNKLVIETVEKYATVHYASDENVNIVTKKSEMPKNYKEYPYIVDNIEEDIYELDYTIMTKSKFQTPKEVYKQFGDLYEQTYFRMTEYFDVILNIDYSTITIDNFLQEINNYSAYVLDKQEVQKYIEYLKANKIKLQGEATPLLPIMYNNGDRYQIRTKITFKIISADTEYNLLFGDEERKVKYDSNEITMYVDVPMGMTFNSRSLLVENVCMAQYIAKETPTVIVEE